MKKHWSSDDAELKQNPKRYAIWLLEQRINHGIGNKKINAENLRTYWNEIDIDEYKRKALQLALADAPA